MKAIVVMASVLLLAACERPVEQEVLPAASTLPEGTLQHAVYAEDIAWQSCAENLPSGCEIAVLEGDPGSVGLFTVRFRLTEAFAIPPHTHPRHERVTVLNGRVSVAFGLDASREDANHFGPGDYYVNARGAIHKVWADAHSELQITGIGPWEVNFVD